MSQERADETEERRRRAGERAGRVTVRRVSFDSSDDEIVGGADLS